MQLESPVYVVHSLNTIYIAQATIQAVEAKHLYRLRAKASWVNIELAYV